MSLLSFQKKRKRLGYLFLLPSTLILGTFLFYPVVNSVIMSFTDWTGFKRSYNWIGLSNYDRLFNDFPQYWTSIGINLKFAFISSAVQTILGFLLAFVVFNLSKRWQKFYQIALYVPAILPAAAVAVMWVFIYDPNFGLLNQALNAVGLSSWAKGWLGEPSTALGSVIVTNTWRFAGFTMILYYIAMLNISKDILEASTVDGAGKLRQLWSFFIPLTWGTTEINFLLSIIGGMKSFDLFYLMTGGGPGTSTQVVGMLIYREAFQNFRFSSALTMSVVLFAIILVISVISRLLLRQKNT